MSELLNGYCLDSMAMGFEMLQDSLESAGVDISQLTDYGVLLQAIAMVETYTPMPLIYTPPPEPSTAVDVHKMTPGKMRKIHVAHMRSLSAKSYGKTKHWKDLCKKALELADHKCFICSLSSRNRALHVHHLTYERLGEESMSDLCVLCPSCHRKEHRLYPELTRPQPEQIS